MYPIEVLTGRPPGPDDAAHRPTPTVSGPGGLTSGWGVPKQTVVKQQQETTEVLTAKSRTRGARPRGSGGPDTETNSRTGPPLKSGAAASGNSSRESLLDLNSLRPSPSSSADYLPLLFHEPQIDENACPDQYYRVANRPCWRTCRKHEPISKKCRPHNTRQ